MEEAKRTPTTGTTEATDWNVHIMSAMVPSSSSLNLRFMGFCGADDSVSPDLLVVLSARYPWVEWGVLFRPDKEGLPRYASAAWVQRLSDARARQRAPDAVRLAAHLCGSRCQDVLEGVGVAFVQELRRLGFQRVQINATAANNVRVDPTNVDVAVNNIRACMQAVPDVEFIIQCNDETRTLWQPLIAHDPLPNMSVLFDPSCGLGVRIHDYPCPLTEPRVIPCGYAGGIGPSNIDDTLAKVADAAGGVAVWIDMESSLRVKVVRDGSGGPEAVDDRFSIDKCFACIHAGVSRHALPEIVLG